MIDWAAVADRSIRDEPPSPAESLAAIRAGEGEFLPVLDAAFRVRRHFHGKAVKIHVLLNAKSGLCPEDCGFCSQSSVATGDIERYKLLSKDEMVDAARKARDHKAWKFCIVTSTRGPSERMGPSALRPRQRPWRKCRLTLRGADPTVPRHGTAHARRTREDRVAGRPGARPRRSG